jgi:hypothetical protein
MLHQIRSSGLIRSTLSVALLGVLLSPVAGCGKSHSSIERPENPKPLPTSARRVHEEGAQAPQAEQNQQQTQEAQQAY